MQNIWYPFVYCQYYQFSFLLFFSSYEMYKYKEILRVYLLHISEMKYIEFSPSEMYTASRNVLIYSQVQQSYKNHYVVSTTFFTKLRSFEIYV